jgi:hypothetical protein
MAPMSTGTPVDLHSGHLADEVISLPNGSPKEHTRLEDRPQNERLG